MIAPGAEPEWQVTFFARCLLADRLEHQLKLFDLALGFFEVLFRPLFQLGVRGSLRNLGKRLRDGILRIVHIFEGVLEYQPGFSWIAPRSWDQGEWSLGGIVP